MGEVTNKGDLHMKSVQRLVAGLLIVSFTTASHAGLIGQPVDASDRERIVVELTKRGVAAEHAQARVAALSDAEAAALGGRIDELPAGGYIQLLGFAAVVVMYVGFGLLKVVGQGVSYVATQTFSALGGEGSGQ